MAAAVFDVVVVGSFVGAAFDVAFVSAVVLVIDWEWAIGKKDSLDQKPSYQVTFCSGVLVLMWPECSR